MPFLLVSWEQSTSDTPATCKLERRPDAIDNFGLSEYAVKDLMEPYSCASFSIKLTTSSIKLLNGGGNLSGSKQSRLGHNIRTILRTDIPEDTDSVFLHHE